MIMFPSFLCRRGNLIESESRERKILVEVWPIQLFEAVLSHLRRVSLERKQLVYSDDAEVVDFALGPLKICNVVCHSLKGVLNPK